MLSAIQSRRNTQPKPPVPPSAQETEFLIQAADQDFYRAQSLDNTDCDDDKMVGSVLVKAQAGQPEYERYFVGDLTKGSICRDSRKMTEFEGNTVKITYRTSFVEDGRMGTDSTWFMMDRNQVDLSTSGAKRSYLQECP